MNFRVHVYVLFFIIFFVINGNSQSDSLSKFLKDQQIRSIMDDEIADLRKQGITRSFKFITYYYTTAKATLVWKDGVKIFANTFTYDYAKKRVKRRKINLSSVDNLLLDSLFVEDCDLKNTIVKENDVKIIHDFIVFVEKNIDGHIQQNYFWYSNFLNPDNFTCQRIYNRLFQIGVR